MPGTGLAPGQRSVVSFNNAKGQGALPTLLHRFSTVWLFLAFLLLLIATHAPLLRLPYFWDEAGYYIPAARDLLTGSLIPHSTPSNAHPPLVMAWMALAWKVFGQTQLVTRCAMLLVVAFSLTGFFRLAKAVSNTTVAAASTFLVAIYPVFFAQSSLAQVDLPAAGLTFWGLEAYVRRRKANMAVWLSLAALAKETAILVPVALFAWELLKVLCRFKSEEPRRTRSYTKEFDASVFALVLPVFPLGFWYVYHYTHTGFVFGNPEFFRYNLQGNLSLLRIFLALLLRLWQAVGYFGLYVLTVACLVAMRFPAQRLAAQDSPGANDEQPTTNDDSGDLRPRIAVPIQLAFLSVATVYILAMSVLGGAMLARYMLPIVPLVILICVSTVWRRLKAWKAVLAVVALGFVAGIFINPPYGFSPEDNLAYADYIHLHQRAEAFIESHDPHAHVLTAWPASDELSRTYLGYVEKPMPVVRIEDFTTEQLLSAADARSRFDVALVFSTKYQSPHSVFDRWRLWQQWKMRYFGYHVDMTPEAAASVLGGRLVYVERRQGQWVGVIQMDKIEEARNQASGVRFRLPASALRF
jgi:fumarate reductase subunit D